MLQKQQQQWKTHFLLVVCDLLWCVTVNLSFRALLAGGYCCFTAKSNISGVVTSPSCFQLLVLAVFA